MMPSGIPKKLWWCPWSVCATIEKPNCPPLHKGTQGTCGRCEGPRMLLVSVESAEEEKPR